MSIITKIELNGNEADIYIDNEFYSSLSYFVVMANRLKVGQEVDIDEVDRIVAESDIENASQYAYKYLAKYSCTKAKLINKIKEKGYPYAVAKIVADKVEENGFIDDYAYAERFVKSKSNVWGMNKIKAELMFKGVPSSVISEVVSEIEDIDKLENAKSVAKKWFNSHELDDRKDEEKFYRFMSYRGFDYGLIVKCRDWLKRDEDEFDE